MEECIWCWKKYIIWLTWWILVWETWIEYKLCNLCKVDFKEDERIYIEYSWAYDWRLTWKYTKWDDEYHRNNNEKVLEYKQPIKYWSIYFKTESNYYRNLTKITKKKYDTL